ncbi:MAG: type II toxin-antitoxin system CcdA family antitoxin [Gammaproteobacteria bacterium]|nr:type II toxin-antitoxin system CcdA family antitoxin [Gammaproteobacteria bacterium]
MGAQEKSGFDPRARKRPVNLTLNEDLVRQVKEQTGNLSAVVESLLARHLERQEQERIERARQAQAAVRQWNDFGQKAGSVADEYSPF